jgi:enoyl-CoA hydratase/carnithine racemase
VSDRVTVSIDSGIADVRLNRPDKLNALDAAMFQAIAEAGEALKSEAGLRAVVLSGEGRGFCAGLDFASFMGMADGGARSERVNPVGETNGRITHLGQQVAWVWTEVPVPVIAAVTGPCLGGGMQIALGADIRIVAPDATLGVLEVHWGLIPDMSGTVTLARIVGTEIARDLVYTARRVSGEEAVRLGLASRLSDDPRRDAFVLAQEIAARSPHAVRAAKRLMATSGQQSAADQLAAERQEIGQLIGSPNQIEAVMAGMEKRPANFADLD